MRSQCCLFVDAGYLLASAATRLTGTSLRSGIKVNYEQLIAALTRQAEEVAGMPLLRINWYDAAKNAIPDRDQERIGSLSRVKVRLGRVGIDGEQKGVDLRIGLDMAAQARNGAVDVILLVSGDDDLTEAVEEAQLHGVQVKVLAVPDNGGKPHGVSGHLLRASDGIELVDPRALDKTVLRAVVKTPADVIVPAPPAPRPGPPHPAPTPKPGPVPGPAPVYTSVAGPTPRRQVESTLAYQSVTGGKTSIAAEYDVSDEKLNQDIDAVVSGVIASFLATASQSQKEEVVKAKPHIPSDLDRALLIDLSHRLDGRDLSDRVRYDLRDHFWESISRLVK
ncbi:MAG: NYN domain-containing protein [Bifidobacteriaceae bacterium]|jgi:uncharacterized LabA/DUF88 family protein|nr:NYN domain-containing protein [Bifidobacteriaceae bacterium]